MHSKLWLWAECLLLFGGTPFLFYYLVTTPPAEIPIDLGFELRRSLFPLLWLIAIVAMYRYKRTYQQRIFPAMDWPDFRRRILPRFALSAIFMLGVVLVLAPERLFQFPLERPRLWMLVMIFYPLFSVVPQEIIFRLFFFERYAPLFKEGWPMILASGLAFGHGHLLFNNNFAYFMSIAGGILFSITYARTRNLSLVWLEHAIYGQCVFTVGLGWYFYTGAAAAHG